MATFEFDLISVVEFFTLLVVISTAYGWYLFFDFWGAVAYCLFMVVGILLYWNTIYR